MAALPKRDWSWLVRWAAAVLCVAVAAVGLWTGDTETLVIAGLLLGANLLLRFRSGLLGLLGAALLAADIAFWLTPALVANLVNGEGLHGVAVPAVLVSASWVLLVASVVALVRRRATTASGAGPAVVVLGGLAVAAVATGIGLFGDRESRRPGDIEVDLEDTAFVPDELEVPAGPTAFYLANEDLFWHTFTIEGTDVDVRLSSRGTRRVEVDLAPGSYAIVCDIPGHESVGMTGTLEVR